ncbi:hypothetical protein G9C98_003975 [Cotesia typhae]|uniref:RRM domain-containing protein n=1 Tax=Cotesia typhae TaxID=2053667 RepID=A0A8J5R2G3_9HYME|nr:hypothetical protein G9C98_003975 [Cotesia typhae]
MAIPKGAQKAGKVQPAKAIKEGQVKKNKQPKFKQTPKGKVQLVHDKKNVLSPEEKAEVDKRSIYVGNVPKDIKEARIKSEFSKFGPIESLRIRGVVPESPKMSYKTAAIKRKIHQKCTSICVFIVYKAEESVVKALAMNGKQLEGFYLRVDRVNQEKKRDPKKSIFLGNLPFDTEDNELWEMFLKCGKIEDVRTVRDRMTGSCRGIAYINFKTEDGATLALNLNGTEFRKREMRVQRYQQQQPNQSKPKFGNKRPHNSKHQGGSPKKNKKNDAGENETVKFQGKKKEKKPQNSSEAAKKSPAQSDESFQGQTVDAKKKGKKANKFEKKKKNMAGKLMSKPKKPIS